MTSTPSLSNNRFACLAETIDIISDDTNETVEDIQSPPSATPLKKSRIPKWESKLPKRFVISATPSARSLNLKVQIQTTDTAELFSTSALLDSGATGLFIDSEYVRKNRITTRSLKRSIPVYNVDGIANEAGNICSVVDAVLWYDTYPND